MDERWKISWYDERESLMLNSINREELAQYIAKDIPEGSYVNLGIGAPTLVANYLPKGSEIILHTENGMLGMGPAPVADKIDPDLINAGKLAVTEVAGAAYFHHADSFAMMRGGHLDICVLGAFQVSIYGDLANWNTGGEKDIPAVGGAMDLAIGAKKVFVMMDLFTKDKKSKLVKACTYPLTSIGSVSRVYSDVAVFEISKAGAKIIEYFAGNTNNEIAEATGLNFI